jgi:hypothetical protein
MNRALVFLCLASLALAACTGDGPADYAPSGGELDEDAGAPPECGARPTEGCPCEPGSEPVSCYPDPIEMPGGGLVCQAGSMYCVDGVWGECESVHTWELSADDAHPDFGALVDGPVMCNPCRPDCSVARDYPVAGDLPGRSTGVEYDPARGGIVLTPTGSGTGAWATDTDRDGVPDIADDFPMDPTRTGVEGGFYHTLPYGGSAVSDPMNIATTVRTADVYFLMDTTGSMGGELYNLQSQLTSGTFIAGCSGGIIGAIRCTIPDAWFGVGWHDDYPVDPYGGAGTDYVYGHRLDITSDTAAAQTAVNSLAIHWGYDWPESQSQALWAIATGGGLGPFLTARSGCPAGRWGYPCFRGGTIPITVLFTDAPFHNGPNPANDYGSFSGGSTPPLMLPAATPVAGNERFCASTGCPYDAGTVTGRWVGFTGNTTGMVNDHAAGCSGNGAEAVFRFTLSAAGTVRLWASGSSYDTVLSLRDSNFVEITCNDDADGTLQSRIDISLGAGTYYAMIDGYAGSTGAYRLSIGTAFSGTLPATTAVSGNERFCAATNCPFFTGDAATTWTGWSGNTAAMTNDHSTGCNGIGSGDAVFRFNVSAASTVTATLEGSGYDTVLAIYDSTMSTQLACNDNSIGLQSRVDVALSPGTYHAVVDGYYGSAGAYRFSLGRAPPTMMTGGTYPIPWPTVVSAMTSRDMKFICVESDGGWSPDARNDCVNLANATGSVDGAGAPYVFSVPSDGSGLGTAVVDAVRNLANYSRMDITAVPLDNTATAIDERCLVDSITATSYPAGRCTGIAGGTTFLGCLPGTTVNFTVTFRNDCVMPTTVPQVFNFYIDTLGNGSYVLGHTPVRVVVPPMVLTYPPSGSYFRDYDSTARCPASMGLRPDWDTLTWTATTPPDSRIRFEMRTSETLGGLPTATPVSFDVPPTAPPADVGARLVAAAQRNGLPYLRVTAVLMSSTDRTITPVLSGFELRFNCTAME